MVLKFQKVVANIGGSVRHDRMGGRDYLVAPMVMLTEGVHAGTNGPLFYPQEELKKFPEVWNHKPVVVYHPIANGTAMSACQPDVLSTRGIGIVMNAHWDGRLKAEAWIEETRVAQVDKRVLETLQQGTVMEVSTGLYTENEVAPGEWNGEKYTEIARNHRPDHLALLPDEKGACSVADGAGLNVNREFTPEQRTALVKSGEAMPDGGYPIVNVDDLKSAVRAARGAKNPAAAKRHIRKRAKALGMTSLIPDDWGATRNSGLLIEAADEIVARFNTNAMSFGAIKSAVSQELRAKIGDDWNGYIEDMFPDYTVFSNDGNLYRHDYHVNSDGQISLVGTPKPVKRVLSYEPLTTPAANTAPLLKESEMNKKERVDHLIANAGWTETDREFLTTLSDERLALIGKPAAAPAAPPVVPPPAQVANTTPAAPTQAQVLTALSGLSNEQYIANAPAGIRDYLADGLAAAAQERAGLVTEITANKANIFTPEQLGVKPTPELRAIAVIARATAAPAVGYHRMPNYAGAAGAPVTNVAPAFEPLLPPVMNFDTVKK